MAYLAVVFLCGVLLSAGIILLKKPFFSLARRTTALLDAMLFVTPDEDLKQSKIIGALKPLLISLFAFLALSAIVLFLGAAPLLVYSYATHQPLETLDYSGAKFSLTFIVGTVIPFVAVSLLTPKQDYSDLSKLLHRIALDNPNISRSLFSADARFYKKKIRNEKSPFLIVSGLARAGTTALTTVFYQSENFHSLTYANMPFLLSPNLWRIIYKPKTGQLRERSHGDKVMFGYNTVEALEEYFWKVFLEDRFVSADRLKPVEIGEDVYRKYLTYQELLRPEPDAKTIYLAKNNNFILRYHELRKYDNNFVFLVLFRDPVQQAYSLLSQHKRYTKLQQQDTFVAEYMNWLGHYEFGGNHKYFDFQNFVKPLESLDPFAIDYWLVVWISYYSRVLDLPEDTNRLLVDYDDFLADPVMVVKGVGKKLGIEISTDAISKFENAKQINAKCSEDILDQARRIHSELKARRTTF